ncbi:MAG: 50S ribosomal protein L13 [Candidatus Niyogibacteria bacterium RIFCSPLOWO2_12_FULL_41_13]|uniref:Large ribosomal subunit protein uL13 n=1 Tax=Candidatus Niyogibacteria bacterium RIFCSPLOWO2_12_FULL_41_13 TaxID=1801726 RepID=A0A1G2F1E0_9BACT|nr:MAG: 50S ribosomal protein L13 [Candidatus Niyogibacteria bacterium RIFCSPLOWO2_12_FULL_41_13]
MEQIINAENQSLGRLASQVAKILQGKENPAYRPNIVLPIKVKIINASKIKISEDKLKQKKYYRHSGYPTGLKKISAEKLFKEKPSMVFEKAVSGMLPKNKLRKIYLKNLIIEN